MNVIANICIVSDMISMAVEMVYYCIFLYRVFHICSIGMFMKSKIYSSNAMQVYDCDI